MKIKPGSFKSVLLTSFLSLLIVFSLAPVVCATEITADYAGGTITNGMLINPASNAISITGTTTLSGRSTVGSENYSFRTANGNAITIASGAVIDGASLNGEIAFLHGSHTTIAGTVNLNTNARVRLGVGGPPATLENPV